MKPADLDALFRANLLPLVVPVAALGEAYPYIDKHVLRAAMDAGELGEVVNGGKAGPAYRTENIMKWIQKTRS